MKIGFDAKRALMNDTGLGVYSRNLINGLLRNFPENDYHLFTPKIKEYLLEQIDGEYKIELPERGIDKLIPSYWRTRNVIKDIAALRLDLYHGLSNELPFGIDKHRGVKKVVTIHDLIFLKEKKQYPLADRLIYETKIRYACKVADKIIAISGQTKSDLIKLIGADERKIEVVYQSCDNIFSSNITNEDMETVRLKHVLNEYFILNVSSFYPRKNHLLLVKAFEQIMAKVPHNLVLVGGYEMERKTIENYIAEKNIASRIKILSNLPLAELAAIYRLADLFVYPSQFEGFGIPILEAMTSGTRVLASDVECFRELGGDAIDYFDLDNLNSFAEKMLHLIHYKSQETALLKTRSEIFSNETFSKKIMEAYQ